jgi:hypothetical protein
MVNFLGMIKKTVIVLVILLFGFCLIWLLAKPIKNVLNSTHTNELKKPLSEQQE